MCKSKKHFKTIAKTALKIADDVKDDSIGLDKAKTILSSLRVAHNAKVQEIKLTPQETD